jgi:DNA invertase Pin-like site-specific DNA recombinase
MATESYSKVAREHLERDAFLYVRQSTPRQVVENTESTKRQYALRDRAVALGWPLERIHVIDNDQGHSGSQAQGRAGFQQLVSEVVMGHAGIVMGLEVSRLARNCADWHRLIELCAITTCLILDEEGVYDPAQFNDRLLLGLKGTMSEAELHIIKARLRGGILNKARRGELEMRLPIGLVHRPDGQVELDYDQQIQGVLRLVFDTFEREGSAMKTLKLLRAQGIVFPRRLHSGPQKGDVVWCCPVHSRLLQILHNPRYAGAFVYGRTRTRPRPEGGTSHRKLPREEWQVVMRDVHPGYISWEQYEANQRRLSDNACSLGLERKGGAPREGCALLQGRVICGKCGERMSVRYEQQAAGLVPVYVCQQEAIQNGKPLCQSVPGKAVDPAIGKLLLDTVAPAALELALAVQSEIEQRLAQADTLRQQQVERARYEAELARRRFLKVDPDNRLVADQLEGEWNARLRDLQCAQEDYDQQHQAARAQIDATMRAKVLTLVENFPRVWNDPQTPQRERKRMLALLIEDVTLIKDDVITAHVRLRGGQTRTLTFARPRPIAQIRKTKPEVVAEIDQLLETHSDREVVTALNRQGHRTWKGEPFTLHKIFHLRQAYGLKSHSARLLAQGLVSSAALAKRFGVTVETINAWGRKGLLRRRICENGHRCVYEPLGDTTIVKGHGGRHPTSERSTNSQRCK